MPFFGIKSTCGTHICRNMDTTALIGVHLIWRDLLQIFSQALEYSIIDNVALFKFVGSWRRYGWQLSV